MEQEDPDDQEADEVLHAPAGAEQHAEHQQVDARPHQRGEQRPQLPEVAALVARVRLRRGQAHREVAAGPQRADVRRQRRSYADPGEAVPGRQLGGAQPPRSARPDSAVLTGAVTLTAGAPRRPWSPRGCRRTAARTRPARRRRTRACVLHQDHQVGEATPRWPGRWRAAPGRPTSHSVTCGSWKTTLRAEQVEVPGQRDAPATRAGRRCRACRSRRAAAPSSRASALPCVVEQVLRAVGDVRRHRRVDLLRPARRTGTGSRAWPRTLWREVVRVDRDAVPADARAGVERLEAERLGRRRSGSRPTGRCSSSWQNRAISLTSAMLTCR